MSDLSVSGSTPSATADPLAVAKAKARRDAAKAKTPPPPPLKTSEGKAVPPINWGARMTPQELEAARAALIELMDSGGELQAILTNAILLVLQSLFLMRQTQDDADVIAINTQASEMKAAAKKIDEEAGWVIGSAAVGGTIKAGAAIGSLGGGLKAARSASRTGGSFEQQLGAYNAGMNRVNAMSGLGQAAGDTTGGVLSGISKESEAASKTEEAVAQQEGGREQRDAKAEEALRQFIQSVLQTIQQILDAEHQTKTKVNA